MHVGLLNVQGKKMSKSLGNFITIKDFLKKHSPDALRLIVTAHHYRSPIDYTGKLIASAQSSLNAIQEFLLKLDLREKSKVKSKNGKTIDLSGYEEKFLKSLAHDFNTPKALAAIFDLINVLNPKIWLVDGKTAGSVKNWIKDKLQIFGIKIAAAKIPEKIRAFASKRELLRSNEQFIEADVLRKQIESLGYKMEDTPLGPLVLKDQKIESRK